MSVNVQFTNEVGRIVGLIAQQHPECSIGIRWTEGSPETLWAVVADDGSTGHVYLVDDEQGTWAPATEAEAAQVTANAPLSY